MRAEIPVRMRSADPAHPFDIITRTLIVNAQGCGLHAPCDLPIGVPVELAIEDRVVAGRILNSTAVDAEKGSWVAGIQLDRPGNVWGIPNPPPDWTIAGKPAPAAVARHPFAKPSVVKPAIPKAVTAAPAPAALPINSVATPAVVPAPELADTRKRLEALTDEMAGHLRARASADWDSWRAQAESAMRQLQQELATDLSARIGSRHDALKKAMDSLSEMVSLAEQRRNELASGVSGLSAASQTREETLHSTAEQMSAQWLRDSEEAMGGLRARVAELVAQQEAEVAARLAERQNDLIRRVETGSEKLERLLVAADRALEQMEGWEKRSASSAELLRAAEAALEDIDKRRAEAQAAVQQTAAASVEKLNAAVTSGEQQLESKVQQLSWEYEAQAEAAGQKLESRLAEALNKLRQSLVEHESSLAATAQSQRDGLATGLSAQLQGEYERHLASLREQAERQAGKASEGVDQQQRTRDAEIEASQQKLAAGMADLVARQEQVAAQIAELQKTKSEIEAITASLPATIIAQAQQQASVAWEQLRADSQKMIAETVGAETQRRVASLSEDVTAHARTLREQLADQAGQMAAELQNKIAASLADRQEQIAGELRAVMEQAARDFSAQAQTQAKSHQSATEAVQDSARRRLEEIASRSEHLLAESEAALYKSAEEIISSEIARAQQQIRDSAAPQVEAALSNLRAEAARIAGEHTASANAAADRLQQLQSAAKSEATTLQQQTQLARETRDQLAAAANEFSQQARAEADRHRSESDAIYDAARRRLEEVAQRSELLLGETEAALLRSADEIVSGEIARAQEQIRQFTSPHVEAALAGLRADTAKLVGEQSDAARSAADRAEAIANRLQSLQEGASRETETIAARQAQLAREMQDEVAKAAGEFSRHVQAESQRYGAEAAARLQQLEAAGDTQTDVLRKQLEQAQAWLGERTAEFRQSVHDAFLQAAGEIRGRVHSAVDTVDELIQQKSKLAIEGMDSIGARQAETVARTAAEAQRSLEAAQAAAAASAEAELQKKLAETLDHFREDAARLAQSAASRWQSAMEETLRSFPELLRVRLDGPPKG